MDNKTKTAVRSFRNEDFDEKGDLKIDEVEKELVDAIKTNRENLLRPPVNTKATKTEKANESLIDKTAGTGKVEKTDVPKTEANREGENVPLAKPK